ncbi:MAG TPA: UDP-glucose 4-epimerase GalE [Bryobacteraceae bacterium]|jgi:UDP-glucose-4-epimerase GalE
MTNILLTGGAGYIGSHTAKALAAAGYLPVVLDNFSTGNPWAVKWGPLVQGDIRDYDLVSETLARYKIAAVIHLAGSALVGESNRVPQNYFDNNVAGSLGLFKALLDGEVRRVVFSSTCATYGNSRRRLITEDHPQAPVNPYGESKLFVERALHWYGRCFDLRSVCFRYFNAAGADPEGEIGEQHDPETHLIPLTIHAALGRKKCVRVYGTDFPTRDGTAVRDYVHVTDIARAHLMALEYLLKGGESQCLNLGTGRGHSVNEVIEMTRKVSGARLTVRLMQRREGDPASLVADARKAGVVLGWKPVSSDLRTMVETAWRWSAGVRLAVGATMARG